MLSLGLTAAERRAFRDLLSSSHRAHTDLQILDGNDDVISTVEDLVVSGSVSVNKDAPTRTLELEIANVGRRFRFVPDSANSSAFYADNLIRAVRVYDDLRIKVPLFTGPIQTVETSTHTVRVTAVGKEALALEPALAWESRTFPRRMKVTDAIRAIMRAQGERHFDMPDLDVKLRHPVNVTRHTQPWRVCQRLAQSLDRQLFYDARGHLRLRMVPEASLWEFKFGTEDANVTSEPVTTFSLDELRNTIEVLGPNPEGPKKRPRYVAMPNAGHPLSPQSLARNGEPLYLVETIEMSHAKEQEWLKKRGDRELEDRLRSTIDVRFDALPVPHLEAGDLCRLNNDGERSSFRAREFTIPLTVGAMSVGYHRRPNLRRKH